MPVAIDGCELRHGSGGSYSPSEAGKNQVTLLSTTLADLLTLLFRADPGSAVRTPPRA